MTTNQVLEPEAAIDAVLDMGERLGAIATAEQLTKDRKNLDHFIDQLIASYKNFNADATNRVLDVVSLFAVDNTDALLVLKRVVTTQSLFVGHSRSKMLEAQLEKTIEANAKNPSVLTVLSNLPEGFAVKAIGKALRNAARTGELSDSHHVVKDSKHTSPTTQVEERESSQSNLAPFIVGPLQLNNAGVQAGAQEAAGHLVLTNPINLQPGSGLIAFHGVLVVAANSHLMHYFCVKWLPTSWGDALHNRKERLLNTQVANLILSTDVGSTMAKHTWLIGYVAWSTAYSALTSQGAAFIVLPRYLGFTFGSHFLSHAVDNLFQPESRNAVSCLKVAGANAVLGAIASWPAGPIAVPLTAVRALESELRCVTGGFERPGLESSLIVIDLTTAAVFAAVTYGYNKLLAARAYNPDAEPPLRGIGLAMTGLGFVLLTESIARMGLSTDEPYAFINSHKQSIDKTAITLSAFSTLGTLMYAVIALYTGRPTIKSAHGVNANKLTLGLAAKIVSCLAAGVTTVAGAIWALTVSAESRNRLILHASNAATKTGRALGDAAEWSVSKSHALAKYTGRALGDGAQWFVSNSDAIAKRGRALADSMTQHTPQTVMTVNGTMPHYFLSYPVLEVAKTSTPVTPQTTPQTPGAMPPASHTQSSVALVIPGNSLPGPAPRPSRLSKVRKFVETMTGLGKRIVQPVPPLIPTSAPAPINTPSRPRGNSQPTAPSSSRGSGKNGKNGGKQPATSTPAPAPDPAPDPVPVLDPHELDFAQIRTKQEECIIANLKAILLRNAAKVIKTADTPKGLRESLPYSPEVYSYVIQRNGIIKSLTALFQNMRSTSGFNVIEVQRLDDVLKIDTADMVQSFLARIQTNIDGKPAEVPVAYVPKVKEYIDQLRNAEYALKAKLAPSILQRITQRYNDNRMNIASVGCLGISLMANYNIGKLYAYTMFGPVVDKVVNPEALQKVELKLQPVTKWFNDVSEASTHCRDLGYFGTDCINIAWGGSFVVLAGVARPMLNGGFIAFVTTYAVSNELSKLGHRLQPKQSGPTLKECAASIVLSGGSGILSTTLVQVGLGRLRLAFGGPAAIGMGLTNAAATTLECYYGAKAAEEHRSLPYIAGGVVTAIALIGMRFASLRAASTAIATDAPLATGPGLLANVAMLVSKAAIVMVPAQSAYHITDLIVTISEPLREFNNKIDLNYAIVGFTGSLAGGAVGSLIALAITGPIGTLWLGASLVAGAAAGTSAVAFANHMGWIDHHQHEVAPVGVASAHDGVTTQAA